MLFRATSRRTASPVVRSFVGHGVGKELHEDPEGPELRQRRTRSAAGARHVHRYRADGLPVQVRGKDVKDGWTVKTCDGGLAAHFEHTMAITTAGAEVLTYGWEEPGWTL